MKKNTLASAIRFALMDRQVMTTPVLCEASLKRGEIVHYQVSIVIGRSA